MNVLVCYHFFAHYREPVLRGLSASKYCRFEFYGDIRDPDGQIRPANLTGLPQFHRGRSFRISRLPFQPGVPWRVIGSRADAVIFLGDPQHVTTWGGALVVRVMGKRVLFWTHGWTRRELGAKSRVRRAFYRLSHGLLLYGERTKAIGVEQAFGANDLYVIYNSLDFNAQTLQRNQQSTEPLRQLATKLFRGPESPIVICSSRLTRTRRLDLLIDAIALLHKGGYPLNLILVGDRPERSALQSRAKALRAPVHFAGACYDEGRLCDHTMASPVTVAPGAVGLTAMQSMAFGTPVITHGNLDLQIPEAEVIIAGKTGDLFRFGDVKDLAAKIRKWTLASTRSDAVKRACVARIDSCYTPAFQGRTICAAARGVSADEAIPTNESTEVSACSEYR